MVIKEIKQMLTINMNIKWCAAFMNRINEMGMKIAGVLATLLITHNILSRF